MSNICNNCGNVFEGNFCNNCGQAAGMHEINTSFIVHDLQHGLMHVDGGMFHSARQLFTRPGHSIREYIEGKRTKHYKPISMLIVLSGFYGLLYHALKINVFEGKEEGLLEYEIANEWIAHHFSIITLAILPILSFSSYIVFRKQAYNFTEHLILNAFYSSQKLWIRILTLPLFLLTDKAEIFMQCLLVSDFILMVWCYRQFFKDIPSVRVFLMTLGANLLNLLLILIITTIILIFMMNK